MSGRTQTALIKKGRGLVLVLLVFVCYFFSLKAYISIEPSYGVSVFLSDSCPDGARVTEILKMEEEKENPLGLCFYYEGGFGTVYEEEYNRQTKVLAAGISGEAFLYDWRANGFDQEDTSGCLIDGKTAQELFGTTSVIGRKITYGEDTYQIRGVLPLKNQMFLHHPKEQDAVYTKVFVEYKDGESIENIVSQFLMSYGLTGTIVEGEILEKGALLGLCFLPGLMFLTFFIYAGREQKKCGEKNAACWIWKGIRVAMLEAAALVLYWNVQIPTDWLPGRWSDFSFYPERIQQEIEKVRLYLMLSRTAVQAENLILICKSVLLSGVSFVLSLGILLFYRGREGMSQAEK